MGEGFGYAIEQAVLPKLDALNQKNNLKKLNQIIK